MYHVYILRSISEPSEIYIGATEDLWRRMADRNAGHSKQTSKFMPWALECYTSFPDRQRAFDFEHYLKSHSGRAFAAKRLM